MELIEKIKNSKSMSGIIRMINGDDKLNDIVIDRTKYLNDVSIHERLFGYLRRISYHHGWNSNK